jgi:hypothetical protein
MADDSNLPPKFFLSVIVAGASYYTYPHRTLDAGDRSDTPALSEESTGCKMHERGCQKDSSGLHDNLGAGRGRPWEGRKREKQVMILYNTTLLKQPLCSKEKRQICQSAVQPNG